MVYMVDIHVCGGLDVQVANKIGGQPEYNFLPEYELRIATKAATEKYRSHEKRSMM